MRTDTHFLPLCEVQSAGWIHDFLHSQAAGLTGHPEVQGYPYGHKYWGSPNEDTGPYAAWWPYEQTAYWLDGAIKCAYLTGDRALYQRALEEIEYAIQHAAPDGYIGPEMMRHKDRWAHAVFFRAVLAQYEITGNRLYLDALARHYRSTVHPMGWSRDVTGVELLAYLFQATGEVDLLMQAEDLYRRFNALMPDHDASLESLLSDRKATEHGVTFNEIAKLAAILYGVTSKAEYLDAVVHGYAKLDRDQLLADGMHSCSEHLRGRDPLDSHETCDITDHTWALGYLFQVTGEVKYADRIEKIIFNALPGAVTKDFKALQYLSCPNQVSLTHTGNHNRFMRGFNWMSYRPDHEVQCCPGNVHRAMPNYVSRMWLKRGEDEIVAALYGPGQVQTSLGGVRTTIEAQTTYPCEQEVGFVITLEHPACFTFTLRIPGWCKRPAVTVNGSPVVLGRAPFVLITREWQTGDRVRLELPFELGLQQFPKGGVSIDYGPLTMSLPVSAHTEIERGDSTNDQRRDVQGAYYISRQKGATADFPAWELTPTSPWNYALCVDEDNLGQVAQVQWNGLQGNPFDPAKPFVSLRVPARRVKGWEIVQRKSIVQLTNRVVDGKWKFGDRIYRGDFALTPPLPSRRELRQRLSEDMAWIELVPYGSTLLRLTVFPQACK